MRTIELADGSRMPALGLGTWRMGEKSEAAAAEVAALKAGLDAGIRLIDTAEMYGEGGAEKIVAEAVSGRRDEIFIVSKVYPHNASRTGTVAACERSLRRLATDCIDLYLLHWRGATPLAETVEAMETLKAAGKIARWGVSNFDVADMAELAAVAPPASCVANQVLYHLGERGIESAVHSDARRRKMAIMAYSPLGQAAILKHPALTGVAAKHGVDPATVAIAWTLRLEGVVSIPKTAKASRVPSIVRALSLVLDEQDQAALDVAFPPPRGHTALAML